MFKPQHPKRRENTPFLRRAPLAAAISLALCAGAALSSPSVSAATIQGYSFFDRNHNNLRDTGEGIAGEKIYIRYEQANASKPTLPILTDANGRFVYGTSSLGNYKLWTSSTVNNPITINIAKITDVINSDFVNQAPVKTLAASSVETKVGRNVNFTITSSANDNAAFQVTWDFGDGQSTSSESIVATGTDGSLTTSAQHRYFTVGDFTATANLTYTGGATETLTIPVKVKANSAPVVKITSPIGGDPVDVRAGDSYTLEAAISDPDAGDTHRIYYSIYDNNNYTSNQVETTAPYTLNIPYTVSGQVLSDGTSSSGSSQPSSSFNAYVCAYDQDWAGSCDNVNLSSLGIKITVPTGDDLQNLQSVT